MPYPYDVDVDEIDGRLVFIAVVGCVIIGGPVATAILIHRLSRSSLKTPLTP